MALLGKSKTLSNLFDKGPLGDVTEGLGIGGLINFVDDRTGGHFKGIGLSLGRTVNGQPLTLNLTDVVLLLTKTGINFRGANLAKMFITLASKKGGEAFGIIMDDPLPNDGRQKMTFPHIKVEKMSNGNGNGMVQLQQEYLSGTFGGVNC